LAAALEEIRYIHVGGHDDNVLIIIASDGGDAVSAVDFVRELNGLPLEYEIKIYEAISAAAYIALATKSKMIEMSKDATLEIHRGELNVSPTDIDKNGRLDNNLLKNFRKYDTALIELMEKFNLGDRTDELYASDWLRLSARECLERGIVQKIF
jgi:ATP-dependent protease ClpP protease subunit